MRLAGILALALAACADSPAGSDAGLPDLAAVADAAADLAPACGPPSTDAGTCLNTVSGKVVDDNGAAIPSLVVSVCAVACFFGKTAADGTFSTPVYNVLVPDFYAFATHGRPDRASYYMRLPPLQGMSASYPQPLLLPSLPASGPLIALDKSAQTLISGDVTLTLTAGTNVMLDVEDVQFHDAGRQLRALKISPPTRMPFVDAAAPPDALYGFAPFEVQFSQKAQLSFANTGITPVGAAVDVLAMGGLLGGPPPAGNFTKVASATVASNGTVVMNVGEGISGLTWIALRKQ